MSSRQNGPVAMKGASLGAAVAVPAVLPSFRAQNGADPMKKECHQRWRCVVVDYDLDLSGPPDDDEWGHFDASCEREAARACVEEWDRNVAETYPVACGEQVVSVLVEALDGSGRKQFIVSGERVPTYYVYAQPPTLGSATLRKAVYADDGFWVPKGSKVVVLEQLGGDGDEYYIIEVMADDQRSVAEVSADVLERS